jgi:hypothetical protein
VLIVEEPSWSEAAEKLGGLQNVDAALDPIIEALALRPDGFPEVSRFSDIRLAKTDRIVRDGGIVVPALRVWFRYLSGDDTVYLLYAEEIPEDA